MYFINPNYEPPVLTSAQKEKKALQIQSLLLTPKEGRSASSKREIYEYFIKNPQLVEIERSKSLRARILCVAEILLISQQQYVESLNLNPLQLKQKQTTPSKSHKDLPQQPSQSQTQPQSTTLFTILHRFPHSHSLAVLHSSTIHSILSSNEQPIRNQMSLLKDFSLLKQFQYHQLLYLANFVQEVGKVNYKEFVFEEGDKADWVYFVGEGEFQVFKNFQQVERKVKKDGSGKKIVRNGKHLSSPLYNYLENDSSPHKVKPIKIRRQELSKIEGGSGQSFGQVQLFVQTENRAFSLKCNSLNSKVFKINYKYFREIFDDNPRRFKKLKKEYTIKYQNDLEKVRLNKNIKERIGSPQQKAPNKLLEENNLASQKLSTIILQMNRYNLSQGNGMEETFIMSNNSLTVPLNELGAKRNLQREKKLFSQNAKKMKINHYGPFSSLELAQSPNNGSKSIQSKGPTLDSPFFPLINKKKSQKSEQISKSPFPGLLEVRRNNKVKGLVDISYIIEEKQQLYNSMSGVHNPQFSFYKLDEKHTKRLNYQKAKLQRNESIDKSPAHSELYMKDLLKRSLRKSGYLPQNFKESTQNTENSLTLQTISRIKTQQMVNSSSLSIMEDSVDSKSQRYLQTEEKPYSLSRQIRASLVNSDFDKFFDRI